MSTIGLEALFTYGSVSKEIEMGANKLRLNVLDSQHLQDALNSSYGVDEIAKLLDYKIQVLARSISSANGETYISDPSNPTAEEIRKVLAILKKFNVVLINKLFDFYDELDSEVKKNLDELIKK